MPSSPRSSHWLQRRFAPLGLALLGCCLVFGMNGCGPKVPPPVTLVEGKLLLDDKPLPFAQIDFVPETSDFGAELNSSAVTDAEGNFTLALADGRNGAVVGNHRVTVMEGPLSKELRNPENQEQLGEYMKKLANRPIPENYGSYGKTPLKVEVTTGQKSYVLKMKR